MSPAWQIILGMLGPVLLLVGVVVTARATRQGGREATRSADWASFAAEVREWTEDRLAERDQRINSLATELAEVRSELGIVRSELDGLARKYRAAITYIRRLVSQLRQHVEPSQIEKPPQEIQIDL